MKIKQSTPENPYAKRRAVVGGILAVLTAGGVLGLTLPGGDPNRTTAPTTQPADKNPLFKPYSETWLNLRPLEQATIPKGGGALNAIEAVDPKLAENGWATSTGRTELVKVEDYINKQATGGSTILQDGQTVAVPVVPAPPAPPTQK
jgi:hypothetical protein